MFLHYSPSSLGCNPQEIKLLGQRDTKSNPYHREGQVLALATITATEKETTWVLWHPQKAVGGDKDYSVQEWKMNQKGKMKTRKKMKSREAHLQEENELALSR